MVYFLVLLTCLSAPTRSDFGLELPEGPAARVWAGVGGATQPIAPATALVADLVAVDPWSRATTWRRWAAALAAEHEAAAPDPTRRAELCLLARVQGRATDAWSHFQALGDAPGHAAGIAAYLLPGVPLDTPLGPGGEPLALQEGVLLRPLVPPPASTDPMRALDYRQARASGIEVGEGRVDLMLSVESTGVQCDVAHAGGESTRLRLLLPAPEGFPVKLLFLDWEEQDDPAAPLLLALGPDDPEERTIWGRVVEDLRDFPTARPGLLPARLVEDGLWLEVEPDEVATAELRAIAEVLGQLLGVPAGVRPAPPLGVPGGPGMALPLGAPGPERAARLAYLAMSVERLLLE